MTSAEEGWTPSNDPEELQDATLDKVVSYDWVSRNVTAEPVVTLLPANFFNYHLVSKDKAGTFAGGVLANLGENMEVSYDL